MQTIDARSDVLAMLLSPDAPGEFLERYFEKEPRHLARGEASYFAGIYSVGEVENSIVVSGAEYERFCLIKAGTNQVTPEVTTIERKSARARHTGRPPSIALDPRAVLSHFDAGYTLLIKDAALFSPRLQKFCNRLQQRLGFYIQTNVYFTPPKAQGFDIHHDTHDTMVMQIEGEKTWRIYNPGVQLPVEFQPYSKEEHGQNLTLNREVVLRAGDTLYIPRGFAHEAMTGAGRSLHVTLAMLPMRVIDLVEVMLQFATITDVELRRALPPGWHQDPDFPASFAKLVSERLPKAFPGAHVRPAMEIVLRDLFAVTRAEGGEAFDDLQRLIGATMSSKVWMRDDTPYVLRRSGEQIELLIAGKSMAFPTAYEPLLRRLEQGPTTVAEVEKMLPNQVGRSLVKMLLLEGLISVE